MAASEAFHHSRRSTQGTPASLPSCFVEAGADISVAMVQAARRRIHCDFFQASQCTRPASSCQQGCWHTTKGTEQHVPALTEASNPSGGPHPKPSGRSCAQQQPSPSQTALGKSGTCPPVRCAPEEIAQPPKGTGAETAACSNAFLGGLMCPQLSARPPPLRPSGLSTPGQGRAGVPTRPRSTATVRPRCSSSMNPQHHQLHPRFSPCYKLFSNISD